MEYLFLLWPIIGLMFAFATFKKDLPLSIALGAMLMGPIAVFPFLQCIEIDRQLKKDIAEIRKRYGVED